MSRQVWKFVIDATDDVQDIKMPAGAKFIKANAYSLKQINMWFEIDEQESLQDTRSFGVFGTGHKIETGLHIYTVLKTPFVWHIYEI